jgi:hypothetical protein
MTLRKLAKIRYDVYTLWYNCTDKKLKQQYKEILEAMDYAVDMKGTIRDISKLGADL